MRLHPLIPGTVGLWQFQGSLADASGNGLDASVDVGSAAYEAIDSCVQGFRFDNGPGGGHAATNGLITPLSALAQMGGEFTAEFIFVPRGTPGQTFFQCETPGGAVLYAMFIDAAVRLCYADKTPINTFLGFPSSPIVWTPYAVAQLPIHVAWRKRSTGGGGFIIECFINGVLQAGTLATTSETATGTERLRFGGFIGQLNNLIGTMASLRIVNYSRLNADILADAILTGGSCVGAFQFKGLLAKIRTVS